MTDRKNERKQARIKDPSRHQRLPARRERPVRRRAQAGPLPARHAGAVRGVGAGLPRGRVRPSRSAGGDAPCRRPCFAPPAHAVYRDRPHGPDEAMGSEETGGAGEGGTVRVRVQGPVAEFRHGAGEGLFGIRNILHHGLRAVRQGVQGTLSPDAHGGRGQAAGPGHPRELHRAGLRLSSLAGAYRLRAARPATWSPFIPLTSTCSCPTAADI